MSERLREVLLRLTENFGENIETCDEFRGQTFVILKAGAPIREIVQFLKSEGFNHLQTLTAVDYLLQGKNPRFEVVYQFYSIDQRISLRLRLQVAEESPEVASIVDLFPSANFFEREVFDLFGIRFRGHPNLKRILLPENWEGYPLRKDYHLMPEEKPKDFLELVELKERLEKDGIR